MQQRKIPGRDGRGDHGAQRQRLGADTVLDTRLAGLLVVPAGAAADRGGGSAPAGLCWW